jgi:hypothetical protein
MRKPQSNSANAGYHGVMVGSDTNAIKLRHVSEPTLITNPTENHPARMLDELKSKRENSTIM